MNYFVRENSWAYFPLRFIIVNIAELLKRSFRQVLHCFSRLSTLSRRIEQQSDLQQWKFTAGYELRITDSTLWTKESSAMTQNIWAIYGRPQGRICCTSRRIAEPNAELPPVRWIILIVWLIKFWLLLAARVFANIYVHIF